MLGTYPNLTNASGNTFGANEDCYNHLRLNTSMACDEIIFGNGTTPPTREDYALSGTKVTGSLSRQDETTATEQLEDGIKIIRSMFVRNTGTEPVTISEVGWVASTVSYTFTNAYGNILLDRTLLEEPVTIPAGEVGQINYSIFLKYGS